MAEETRFRLNSFCEKKAEIQRERLDNLIGDVEGPLRAYWEMVKGEQVLYLGVRTWAQYFEEFFLTHIVCMPKKVAEREEETRKAIARHIEPHLKVRGDVQNAVQNRRHAVELMDKLYMRACKERVCASYFARKQDCEIDLLNIGEDQFVGTKSVRPDPWLTVPKGLSIARIAPAKINADVRILAKPDTSHDAQTREDDDDHCESKVVQVGTGMQHGKENAYLDLAAHYGALLEDHAAGMETVVLQLLSNASLHWFVAHTVSLAFIRNAGGNKPSIMLVPPESEQNPLNQRLSKLSDREWLEERIKNLKHPEGLPPLHTLGYEHWKDDESVPEKPRTASRFPARAYSPPESEETDLEISDDEDS